MKNSFNFRPQMFSTVVGGLSSIDLDRLEVLNLEEATQFLATYGFDTADQKDNDRIWNIHSRAITYIREVILASDEQIPEELIDSSKLVDIGKLLVYASASNSNNLNLQKWSCAILRVMHVFAHIENDIFVEFADQIQEKVLKPFRSCIVDDPVAGILMGRNDQVDQIPLKRFDVKPFKTSDSSVTKLLTKSQAVAFNLTDKMGVRLVTRKVFDAFRVIRFLIDEHVISLPNIMPDQSKNTLYPMNLFAEVARSIKPNASADEWEAELTKRLNQNSHRASFLEKPNEFSSDNYKVIKFIARKLLSLSVDDKNVRFFFPFEVQILDYQTYSENLSGDVAHSEYKKRQKLVARQRVLGSL